MADVFDIVISGFMGWYDCFDFTRLEFTALDTKTGEIWRVLKNGGRFVCCSWLAQEDLRWMEEAILRHFPAIREDSEYLRRRPIGTAYEKPEGYEIILSKAGFQDIESSSEQLECVSTDEEEWWNQMQQVGWASLTRKIEGGREGSLRKVKEAIFKDLQQFKHPDGIHFKKTVFFVSAEKK